MLKKKQSIFIAFILLFAYCNNTNRVENLINRFYQIKEDATSSTVTLMAKSFTGGYMGYSVSDKIDKRDIEECLISRREQRNILSELKSLVSEPVIVPSSEQGSSVKLSPTYLDSLINVNEQRIDDLAELLNWYTLTLNDRK
jgi:hypothetical protein